MSVEVSGNDFLFTATVQGGDCAQIVFAAMPKLCAERCGRITVWWGDGGKSSPEIALDDERFEEIAASDEYSIPKSILTHVYEAAGEYRIIIHTQAGMIPLLHLPEQTTAINSALPTLTIGQTDENLRLLPSEFLPDFLSGSKVTSLPGNLLKLNPKLSYFAESFAGLDLEEIPADLFAWSENICDLTGTFRNCKKLVRVPDGLFANADENTVCSETFAGCTGIAHKVLPFDQDRKPLCTRDMLRGCNFAAFDTEDPLVAGFMGFVRRDATAEDPAFEFEWLCNKENLPEEVITFYEGDLQLDGNVLVDWGNGETELVDWNRVSKVTHAFATVGIHKVKIHAIAGLAVQPFVLGRNCVGMNTPLPAFGRRRVENRHDYCGWAANLRRLERIDTPLFANNPQITDLRQAFAACENLRSVHEDILGGVTNECLVDGMFAFCRSLEKVPESFAKRHRNTAFDMLRIAQFGEKQ